MSIGDNCEIFDTAINNSIIMSNTKIEQNKKISNSIVAYNSKLFSKDSAIVEYLLGENSNIS